METQWTRMTANEAAEIIQHNDMVAFSGFTPAGSPKALPTAIARRANEQHEAKKPYQIRLLTGASISAAADDVLSDADAVSWRAPYQTSSGLRKKINQGAVSFVDLHLSEVAQMVNYGFFGDIDVAVIEASALANSILLLIAVLKAPKPYHSKKTTPPQVTSASNHGDCINNALPPKIPAQIRTKSLIAQSKAIIMWY